MLNELIVILALLVSFSLVLVAIPPVIRVSREKKLYDEINERKIHRQVVPALGGVAIFLAVVVTSMVVSVGHPFYNGRVIFAAMVLLFFIGLKDDIMVLSARAKFGVQFLAAALLVVVGNYRIFSLHGMLGVYEIPWVVSVIFSILLLLTLVNAYNLIDGIDGLNAGLGILGSLVMGTFFWLNGYMAISVISFSLAGALAGFLRFNLSSTQNKIFMGDSGSLNVGLLMGTQVFRFLEINSSPEVAYSFNAAPVLAMAIVIIPLLDLVRVFTLRVLQGKSPFYADKNHIHHQLLLFFRHHYQVTLVLLASNVGFILLSYLLSITSINVNYQFFLVLMAGAAFLLTPMFLLRLRRRETKQETSTLIQFNVIPPVAERKQELVEEEEMA